MRPCIIMHQYCGPMPLKERNSFRLQNLVNVTLSIEVALHNNEICFPSAYNATPYHNTHTSKSVPLNETIISISVHFLMLNISKISRLTMPNLQKKRLLIFEIFNIKKWTLFFGTEYRKFYKNLWEQEKLLVTRIFSFPIICSAQSPSLIAQSVVYRT